MIFGHSSGRILHREVKLESVVAYLDNSTDVALHARFEQAEIRRKYAGRLAMPRRFLWQFEHAWRCGNRPDIAEYLEQVNVEDRDYCVRELVMMDLEYQWNYGREAYVEDYLVRFPQLAQSADGYDGLLAEELRARRRVGKLPTTKERERRFPHDLQRFESILDLVVAEEVGPASADEPTTRKVGSVFAPNTQADSDSDGSSRSVATESRVTSLGLQEGFEFGHYVLREQVGKGAFAVVWRASDLNLHRNVAVKVLRKERLSDESAVSRMVREARAAARVQHPSIVQVYDVGEIGDVPYIVSQYVNGPSLRQSMQQRRYDQREAAELARRIAVGLDHAHRLGIVHRDVKPANILLTPEGRPMIADFGLAHEDQSNDPTLTQAGDILGSPAFMAPEQARGDIHLIDARTDVYAVGAILYELLTGLRPFSGGTASVIHAVIHERALAPRKANPKLDRDLETIVLKCMEKEPQDRYHSARLLADDLQRYLVGDSIVARPAGPTERIWKWTRRNPRSATMVACLVAMIGFLMGTGLQLRAVRVQRDRARQAEAETQDLLAQSAADAGALSMQRGRFDEAIQHFNQSLRLKPQDEIDLRFKRVEVLVASRKIDEARREMQQLDAARPDGRFEGLLLLWQAQLAFERQESDVAEQLLIKSMDCFLPKDELAYATGMLAEQSPTAVKQFREAVRLNPMHHRARRMLVTMLVSLARFDEALTEILTARQLYASDTDFGMLESLVRSSQGDLRAAKAALQQLDLTADERDGWMELCRSVNFLTQSMPPDWHQEADKLNNVVQGFVIKHHPLLAARGIHPPPRIGRAFQGFPDLVLQYAGGASVEPLRDCLRGIVSIHPEGSLFVLLGELQLADKTLESPEDVDDALTSFRESLNHPAYLSNAHIAARSGILGATLYKAFKFEKDWDQSHEEFTRTLAAIDPWTIPVNLPYIRIFASGAVKFGDVDLADKWLARWAAGNWQDEETAKSEGDEIRWLQIEVQQQRKNWLAVLDQCDQFLADHPDHQEALSVRKMAVKNIDLVLKAVQVDPELSGPPKSDLPGSESTVTP